MYLLIPLILAKIGLGLLYYKNKDYINTKIFNKSSEIILYTKKNILSKCINNKFHITDVILVHNNEIINIYYYLFYNLISNNIKNIYNNNYTRELFNYILKHYKIEQDENTRILIKYYLNNIPYIVYWTGNNLKNPIINNEYIKNLKNRYYMNNKTKESVYMLLIIDMKNIVNIKYGEDIIKEDSVLYETINMLKGPLNDYGYLLNSNIKHKWLYDDFNLEKKKITITQGYKINEFFNLESFKHEIEYNEYYINFDIFNKI
jgi:hypothetical protein